MSSRMRKNQVQVQKEAEKNKILEEDDICENNQEEECNSETEMAVLPMSHFAALIQNKDDVIEQYDNDRLRLAAELKAEREYKELYKKAHQKEKDTKIEYQQKCEIQEKELSVLKNKIKPNEKVKEVLTRSKPIMDIKNREELMTDYYDKHYAKDIEKLKKELGI